MKIPVITILKNKTIFFLISVYVMYVKYFFSLQIWWIEKHFVRRQLKPVIVSYMECRFSCISAQNKFTQKNSPLKIFCVICPYSAQFKIFYLQPSVRSTPINLRLLQLICHFWVCRVLSALTYLKQIHKIFQKGIQL